MGKNDDEEGTTGRDAIVLRRAGDEKLFCCAPGYRVLVKDSIVIMSAGKDRAGEQRGRGRARWRSKKDVPGWKLIRSSEIDRHRIAIKESMRRELMDIRVAERYICVTRAIIIKSRAFPFRFRLTCLYLIFAFSSCHQNGTRRDETLELKSQR